MHYKFNEFETVPQVRSPQLSDESNEFDATRTVPQVRSPQLSNPAEFLTVQELEQVNGVKPHDIEVAWMIRKAIEANIQKEEDELLEKQKQLQEQMRQLRM
eukprot:4094512-Karenia_brevis.AAC.1